MVDAVLKGLRSDPIDETQIGRTETIILNTTEGPNATSRTAVPPPDIVSAAVEAARSSGPEAEPLKKDLQRIAADQGHPLTALAAQTALRVLGK